MSSADSRLLRRRCLLDVGILSLAISLRILLALVNQEANDDHLAVAEFLRAARATEQACRVAFVVVALNPSLIGIGAQATNDSLVIFFVSLALLAGVRFFAQPSAASWLLLTAASVLAPLAKGNGLVILPAVAAAFLAALVAARRGPGRQPRRLAVAFVGWAVVVVTALGASFPFGDHYRLFSLPFDERTDAGGIRSARDAFVVRPGVRSIPDALLTFRLVDLLRHPTIENGIAPIPSSRTSLWSMLYGRFHFSRYASWPPSWQAKGGTVEDVGRSAFVLGLPAAVLLGTAIVGRAGTWLRTAVRQPGASLPPPPTTLVDVAVAGYLAFIVAFALAYRDFSFMKDIFVLPAVLAFAALFAQALSTLGQSTRGRAAARLVIAATVLLAVAYVVDVAALAWQLVPRSLSAPSRGRSDPSAVRESGPPRVAREGDGTDDGFAWRRSRSPRFARAMPCAAGSAS